MTTDANTAVIRRYYEELWNGWRLDLAEEMIATDIRFRGSLGVSVEGREGFKHYVARVRGAFPDFHNTIEELIADEDRVAVHLTYRATHTGALFRLRPTGRRVTYTGVAIFHLKSGLITQGLVLGDTWGLLEQLGAVPPVENISQRPSAR
jgi:predicted ester cyclase